MYRHSPSIIVGVHYFSFHLVAYHSHKVCSRYLFVTLTTNTVITIPILVGDYQHEMTVAVVPMFVILMYHNPVILYLSLISPPPPPGAVHVQHIVRLIENKNIPNFKVAIKVAVKIIGRETVISVIGHMVSLFLYSVTLIMLCLHSLLNIINIRNWRPSVVLVRISSLYWFMKNKELQLGLLKE